MEYRNCKVDDLKECAEILKSTYALPPYNEEWELLHAQEYLARFFNFDPAFCFVAVQGDKITGALFSYCYPWHGRESCYIQEIFVSPSAHRKGVGSGLIEKLSDSKGIGPTWLVANKNAIAIKFYDSLGFSIEGPYRFYAGAV